MKLSHLTNGIVVCLLMAIPAQANTSLAVNGDAPKRDNFSMKIGFDGTTTAAFVTDTSPDAETHLYAEFFIQVGSLTMGLNGGGSNADRFNLFRVKTTGIPGSQPPVRVILRRGNLGIVAQVLARDDSGNFIGSPAILLNNAGWQKIRIDWQAASAPGANDGFLRFRRGNGPVKSIENIDNDTYTADRQELGAAGGTDATTTGTMPVDDFASFRTTPADW